MAYPVYAERREDVEKRREHARGFDRGLGCGMVLGAFGAVLVAALVRVLAAVFS